jgi:hypothetical protein
VHVEPITAELVYNIIYPSFIGFHLLLKMTCFGSYNAFLMPKHPFVKAYETLFFSTRLD